MTSLIKNRIVAGVLAVACVTGMTFSMTGCASQTTIADLVAIVGTTIASLETVEGNTTAVTKIQADTAAATAQVLAWKTGTPTTEVIEALNLVEDDLNVLPISTEDQQFVDLAIGTINEVLALLPANTTTATVAHDTIQHRKVSLAKTPKDVKTYKKIWNGLAAKTTKFAGTKLQ